MLYQKIRTMMAIVSTFEFVIAFSQVYSLSRVNVSTAYYSMTGVLFLLGIGLGYAALKAHFKIKELQKRKVI